MFLPRKLVKILTLLPATYKRKAILHLHRLNCHFLYFKNSLKQNAEEGAENGEGNVQQAEKRKANTNSEDYGGKKPKQDDDSKENGMFW